MQVWRRARPPSGDRVGAQDVNIALESADEIGSLSRPELLRFESLAKGGYGAARRASEDEERSSDRMVDLPLLELTILHGREEVAQPAEWRPFQGRVELVPEHQWDHTACLLYTSDAADDLLCVDLGGRRII